MGEVAKINLEKQLTEKQNLQRMEQIANEMIVAKAKAQADAEFYRAQKEAEANRVRITPELIQLEAVRAIANNTKMYAHPHAAAALCCTPRATRAALGTRAGTLVTSCQASFWSRAACQRPAGWPRRQRSCMKT